MWAIFALLNSFLDDFGVGFLVRATYEDLLLSGIKYQLDTSRYIKIGLLYIIFNIYLLKSTQCYIKTGGGGETGHPGSSQQNSRTWSKT